MTDLTWPAVLAAIAPSLALVGLFLRLSIRHEIALRSVGYLAPRKAGDSPQYIFELENLEDRTFNGELCLTFSVQNVKGAIRRIDLADGFATRPTTTWSRWQIRIGALPRAARWRMTVVADGGESDIRLAMTGAGSEPVVVHGRDAPMARRPMLGYSVLTVVLTLGLLAYLLPVVLGVVPFARGEEGLGPADAVLAGGLATVIVAAFYAVRRPPSWSRARRRPHEGIR